MTDSLDNNGLEKDISKSNTEKLREFFKKRFELLESQGLVDAKEVDDGKKS